MNFAGLLIHPIRLQKRKSLYIGARLSNYNGYGNVYICDLYADNCKAIELTNSPKGFDTSIKNLVAQSLQQKTIYM
ncbi:hypothetical protein [Fluviispira sanaruensis]|uniref:Uncharacterized protein n=1 Tax=Fluviispira sanaruensis TaxID=2493639 RepID=A0A4V0P2H1_FLUSA|nr:hypothetical protein [Fluviispira sanaruensis]BBH53207.1 hypothetical protein JCM31447_16500 [Fluviispira sanaruensis]